MQTRFVRTAAVVSAAAMMLAACSSSAGASGSGSSSTASGGLQIGTLLPQTGSLAFLGPPEIAGVKLAVKDINAAGGVNGKDVTVQYGDSGDTTTNIASQTSDRLLGDGVSAIIGPASSAVALNVIDKITGAGVVMMSPAVTSPKLTTYQDDGYFWRTAPSDVLQGRVNGQNIISNGYQKVAILQMNDAYGSGLSANIVKAVKAGGGQIVGGGGKPIVYDPTSKDFTNEVNQVKSSGAQALVLIGFDESKTIINELVAADIGPKNLPLFLVDGNTADYSKVFPKGTLTGVEATYPGAKVADSFKTKLKSVSPGLNNFSYGPESYDGTVLVALAAEQGKKNDGATIKANLQSVSEGGTKCTSYAACKKLIDQGKDIDYDGVSGPIEFNAAGDTTQASIGIFKYGSDNTFTPLKYVEGKLG